MSKFVFIGIELLKLFRYDKNLINILNSSSLFDQLISKDDSVINSVKNVHLDFSMNLL